MCSTPQHAVHSPAQEELQRRSMPSRRRHGIGGAGNVIERSGSVDDTASVRSTTSSMSGADRLMEKMAELF